MMRLGAMRTWARVGPRMCVGPVASPLHAVQWRSFAHSARVMEKDRGVAQYVGAWRMSYYRLKLFSLSSLGVAAMFAPLFILWPHKLEMAARLGIAVTTLGASATSTALISWIGAPYVGHMTLRRADPGSRPLHYISDGVSDVVLDDTPSDPPRHASDKYYLEIATLSWHMRSLKTTVYAPSLLRPSTRAFASWELPTTPPPLTIDDPQSVGAHTVSSLVAETVDVSRGKVVGRWWARWRITPSEDAGPASFTGTCECEGKPVRYFYVDESRLGDEWRVLDS